MKNTFFTPYKLWNLADHLRRPEAIWEQIELGNTRAAWRMLLVELIREHTFQRRCLRNRPEDTAAVIRAMLDILLRRDEDMIAQKLS